MSAFPTVNGVEVLLEAPAGYVVNLDNPARNGDIAAYWAFGVGNALALVLLAQRLYTKIFLASGLQREDGKKSCLFLACGCCFLALDNMTDTLCSKFSIRDTFLGNDH